MFIQIITRQVSNMRYASIRQMDISNGENIGIALFVQGCHFHCLNCFNPQTWDFDGGKVWTPEIENQFIQLAQPSYIKRISFLGGEPLCPENRDTITRISKRLRNIYPDKTQWLYTGYNFGAVKNLEIMKYLDVIVDGEYIDSQRDITLAWRGSKNQRVIDVQKSLVENCVKLYCD